MHATVTSVDLVWLRRHPETIPRLLEHQRIRTTPLGTGHGVATQRWTLDDGTDLFAKLRAEDGAPAAHGGADGSVGPVGGGAVAGSDDSVGDDAAGSDDSVGGDAAGLRPPLVVEGEGLRALAAAGTVAVPEVVTATADLLVTGWVDAAPATPAGAEAFGRDLAGLHAAGAPTFGGDGPGWLAGLPLPNGPLADWPDFYVERRCRPFLRSARDAGALTAAQAARVERALGRVAAAAGPPEPPARLHGDLWSGNVLPARDGRWWLVDPAVHGGHRETDLAMLALFGAPHLDRVLAAYDEAAPLAAGWRDRVGLHQLHPLLVHCVLYGAGYAGRTLAAAATLG